MAGKDQVLKWLEIDDFTPGVIQNLNLAAGLNQSDVVPAPGKVPGQAQKAVGCIALPNGGLAPLPGLATKTPWGATTPVAPQHVPTTGAGAENLIIGLFLNGPIYYYGTSTPFPQTVGDELIIGQANIDSGGNQHLWVDSLQANITSQSLAVNNIVTKGPAVSRLPLATMTGGITRANASASLIGNPCWALAYYMPAGAAGAGASGYWALILYPDPTNPGTAGFVPLVLINGSGGPGDAFCHQNRVVYLQQDQQFWSGDFTFMGGNEAFIYTDPPNGVALLSAAGEIFVQEDPSGYGAWGSQSASELFLVKHRLGGVVISGDLNVPTVTTLEGVMPSYGVVSRGASTAVGFIYASANRGLWAWNGGNASFKLSNQLEDDFFVNPNLPPIQRGPTVDIQRWGDWIVVTNDWLYDTNTNSWWQLPGGSIGSHQWYQASSDGNTLYAAPAVPTTTVGLECYSRLAPANEYTWKSFPIRPPGDSKEKQFLVRKVVIRAQGRGTVTVVVTGNQGANSGAASSPSATLTFSTAHDQSQPSMQIVEMGQNAQDVTVEVTAQGNTATSPAPVIYSIAVGYEEASANVSAT